MFTYVHFRHLCTAGRPGTWHPSSPSWKMTSTKRFQLDLEQVEFTFLKLQLLFPLFSSYNNYKLFLNKFPQSNFELFSMRKKLGHFLHFLVKIFFPLPALGASVAWLGCYLFGTSTDIDKGYWGNIKHHQRLSNLWLKISRNTSEKSRKKTGCFNWLLAPFGSTLFLSTVPCTWTTRAQHGPWTKKTPMVWLETAGHLNGWSKRWVYCKHVHFARLKFI